LGKGTPAPWFGAEDLEVLAFLTACCCRASAVGGTHNSDLTYDYSLKKLAVTPAKARACADGPVGFRALLVRPTLAERKSGNDSKRGFNGRKTGIYTVFGLKKSSYFVVYEILS
jgi:hypothetical protein